MAATSAVDRRIARAGAGVAPTSRASPSRPCHAAARNRKSGRVDLTSSQHAKANHGRADRQGPEAASSSPGHEHEDQGPRA